MAKQGARGRSAERRRRLLIALLGEHRAVTAYQDAPKKGMYPHETLRLRLMLANTEAEKMIAAWPEILESRDTR